MSVFSHSEFDNHQQVAFFNDSASGLKAIIAVHNTNLGPSPRRLPHVALRIG